MFRLRSLVPVMVPFYSTVFLSFQLFSISLQPTPITFSAPHLLMKLFLSRSLMTTTLWRHSQFSIWAFFFFLHFRSIWPVNLSFLYHFLQSALWKQFYAALLTFYFILLTSLFLNFLFAPCSFLTFVLTFGFWIKLICPVFFIYSYFLAYLIWPHDVKYHLHVNIYELYVQHRCLQEIIEQLSRGFCVTTL